MLRVDAGTNMGTLHNFVGKPVSEVGGPAFLQREGKIFQSGADSASISERSELRVRVDGVVAMPRRLDAVDAAA